MHRQPGRIPVEGWALGLRVSAFKFNPLPQSEFHPQPQKRVSRDALAPALSSHNLAADGQVGSNEDVLQMKESFDHANFRYYSQRGLVTTAVYCTLQNVKKRNGCRYELFFHLAPMGTAEKKACTRVVFVICLLPSSRSLM